VIPVTKPGKDNSEEVSKVLPISLLNVGGKVLEIVLINRINYHANSQSSPNKPTKCRRESLGNSFNK